MKTKFSSPNHLKSKSGPPILWLDEPDAQNYPAALSYLSLIYRSKEVRAVVKRLKAALVVEYKAKDIFRASRLSLLGVSNLHVERDRKKIKKREGLSPLLMVRDPEHGNVVIADGYHRLCAIYSFDEDAMIRCKICGF